MTQPPSEPAHARELERIRGEYAHRDEGGTSATYSFDNPAYVFHRLELEWAMLGALQRAGFQLTGTSVLEVGCGDGSLLERFVDFGAASGTGIDLMPHRVALGRRRHPHLDLREGDAAALPFADAAFDLVTQFTCISSVLDSDVRKRIAAEMWRVLRPGGLILSYDLRPVPAPVSALGRAVRTVGARGSGHLAAESTPIAPVSVAESRHLWPLADPMETRVVSLELGLARVAARGRSLAFALALVPFLRTHLLITGKKPEAQAGLA